MSAVNGPTKWWTSIVLQPMGNGYPVDDDAALYVALNGSARTETFGSDHVGLIEPHRAGRVLERLLDTPTANPFADPVSLAVVYQIAQKFGWKARALAPAQVTP